MKPTPDPRPLTPTNGRAADPGSALGDFLDTSGALRARAGEVGGRVTEDLNRLVAQEVVNRAAGETPTPTPGWVVRLMRRTFGRGRPATPAPRRPVPTRSADLAPTPTWMRWVGVWFGRTFGSLPLIAPLAVSGWYTVHVGTEALNLPVAIAIALTLALEGGVWMLAQLYEATLVAGDSTVALRLGLFAYIAAIGGLIFWHATAAAKSLADADWRPAVVVAAMSAAGFYVWSRRARWTRRSELRAAGRVDAQLVRFSLWSWMVAPLETPAALRYAVKHRIEEPVRAVDEYRAARDARREGRAARSGAKKAGKKLRPAKPTPTPDQQPTPAAKPTRPAQRNRPTPTPTPAPAAPTADRESPDPRPVDKPTSPTADPKPTTDSPTESTQSAPARSAGRAVLGSADDGPILTTLGERFPGRVPSINEVQDVVKADAGTCSRSKAIRLRDLIKTELTEQSA